MEVLFPQIVNYVQGSRLLVKMETAVEIDMPEDMEPIYRWKRSKPIVPTRSCNGSSVAIM